MALDRERPGKSQLSLKNRDWMEFICKVKLCPQKLALSSICCRWWICLVLEDKPRPTGHSRRFIKHRNYGRLSVDSGTQTVTQLLSTPPPWSSHLPTRTTCAARRHRQGERAPCDSMSSGHILLACSFFGQSYAQKPDQYLPQSLGCGHCHPL